LIVLIDEQVPVRLLIILDEDGDLAKIAKKAKFFD
jgi:hypothetical protein